MGSTKGYFDDVRYISNYSKGALGTKITDELFRNGIKVHVVSGGAEILPSTFTSLTRVNTNGEMEESCLELIKDHKGNIHIVMLVSVLDYVPPAQIRWKNQIRLSNNESGTNSD